MNEKLKLKLIQNNCKYNTFLFDIFYDAGNETIELKVKESNGVKSTNKFLYKLADIVRYKDNGSICGYVYNVLIEKGHGQLKLF